MNYLNIFLYLLAYIAIGVCVMLLTLKIIGRSVRREKKDVIAFLVLLWVPFVALAVTIFVAELLSEALKVAYKKVFE